MLADGDGVLLRDLTRFVGGDDRPKQFCPLLGKKTLLQETQQRAERNIPADNILLYSLNRARQNYYPDELGARASQLVIQPGNKGTAPAVLYSLLHLALKDPDAVVAILPCDHYYSRETIFTGALESAFGLAQARAECVVLLGATPKGPETDMGGLSRGRVPVLTRTLFAS